MHVQMLAAGDLGQLPVLLRHLEAFAQCAQRRQAALLVHQVARPLLRRRQRLAQVVGQRGEADQCVARRQPRGHVADQFLVAPGVDLGVVLGALRHPVQGVQLRQHPAQRIGLAQRAQERRGLRRGQAAPQFLPDAFGHQRFQFAAGGHRAHQVHGLGRDDESQRRQPRHEPRRAQHPQRILGEGRANVAQHPLLEIARAAIRIDQTPIGLVAGDGVDGEVAPLQILFQRHRRVGLHLEAVVAAPGLALGARQRVLLAAARMQEYREIAAHLLVA
ncbi:hypothetical protein NB713_003651 [Xanthomonas sacchari]|nr:hypothetical protein [Xanthomonas sacchari]